MATLRQQRGRLGGLRKGRPVDDPLVIEAARDLTASRLEDYVARQLAKAPPLTDEQRARIAALLRPDSVSADVGADVSTRRRSAGSREVA